MFRAALSLFTLFSTVLFLSGFSTIGHATNQHSISDVIHGDTQSVKSLSPPTIFAVGKTKVTAVKVAADWNPVPNAPSLSVVEQLFTCQANDDSVFILGLGPDGSAGISDPDTGQQYNGQYLINDSSVTVSLDNGGSLRSSELVTDGKDILYMNMGFPDGSDTNCIARTLHVDEVVATDVILSCNDGATTGNLRNDFRLYTNGAAEWNYYLKLGADELYGSFVGTYRLDSAQALVSMVFLDRDPLDLRFFTASVNISEPKFLSTPQDGDGSSLVGDACELFNAQ